ncbi:MAG: hypothetical protein ACXAD7_10845, partial [Candidatus Kariarchaeaceae archaeon]
MRDDPIIFEDWRIGYSDYFNFRNTKLLDLFLSLIFCFYNLYIGIKYQLGVLVFTWLFGILIVLLVEGLIEQ